MVEIQIRGKAVHGRVRDIVLSQPLSVTFVQDFPAFVMSGLASSGSRSYRSYRSIVEPAHPVKAMRTNRMIEQPVRRCGSPVQRKLSGSVVADLPFPQVGCVLRRHSEGVQPLSPRKIRLNCARLPNPDV